MEEEKDTFDNALVEILTGQLMDNFDSQLREKIKSIVKTQDPKALRQLLKNLHKSLTGC